MILWTIQSAAAWQRAQACGVLRADAAYVDGDFRSAYEWLVAQMDCCIGPRPAGVTFPVWAWYQWEGSQKRPDLRSSGYLPRGERGVRVEFAIGNDRVLLSDFDLWHYALNYWYLPANEPDDQAFAAELAAQGLPTHSRELMRYPIAHQRIVGSWQRMVDPDWIDAYSIPQATTDRSIQATLWELPLDDVRDVKEFVAR